MPKFCERVVQQQWHRAEPNCDGSQVQQNKSHSRASRPTYDSRRITSIDAAGSQKDIVRKIISKGADYLIALKANQRALSEASNFRRELGYFQAKPQRASKA